MALTPERRDFYRLRLKPPVKPFFQVSGGELARDASLIDLSGGGCQVRTSVDYPLSGQEVKISFAIGANTWDLTGRLAWKRRALTSFFYGIKFTRLTRAEEDRLVRALFALERSQRQA